jgi:hypothetical protein
VVCKIVCEYKLQLGDFFGGLCGDMEEISELMYLEYKILRCLEMVVLRRDYGATTPCALRP